MHRGKLNCAAGHAGKPASPPFPIAELHATKRWPTADSRLPAALVQAYLRTCYRVCHRGEVVDLWIGRWLPQIDRFLHRQGARRGIWLTACNPGSRPAPHWRNQRADQELARALRWRRGSCVRAVALALAGDWPPEPGYLVLNLSLREGVRLGRRFGQNGIVTVQSGRPVRLVLLR